MIANSDGSGRAGFDNNVSILADVDAYDPVANSWTIREALPTPRQGFTVGAVNGVLFAVGGSNSSGQVLGATESLAP